MPIIFGQCLYKHRTKYSPFPYHGFELYQIYKRDFFLVKKPDIAENPKNNSF